MLTSWESKDFAFSANCWEVGDVVVGSALDMGDLDRSVVKLWARLRTSVMFSFVMGSGFADAGWGGAKREVWVMCKGVEVRLRTVRLGIILDSGIAGDGDGDGEVGVDVGRRGEITDVGLRTVAGAGYLTHENHRLLDVDVEYTASALRHHAEFV